MEVVYETKGAWIERHDTPAGPIFYKDGPSLDPKQAHSYWERWVKGLSCSGRVSGVSTIAKNDGDSKEGLMDWLVREALAGRDPHKTRDAKADVGSDSHTVLQDLSEGAPPFLETGYDRAVASWWKERTPEVEMVEQVVYAPVSKFAGRFDLLAFLDGALTLLDLKTSKAPRNSFAIQLNLYRLAMREAEQHDPDRLMILLVREDGSWQEVAIPINPDWAIAALRTYENGKDIRAALREAEKTPKQGALV